MAETITIYSFGDNDRGGKVRWTARELGLDVEEARVGMGEHRQAPYNELNALEQIPTARFRGTVLTESTAICHTIAEAVDEPKLWVGRGEPEREAYLFWLAAFGETVEARLVECAVSLIGFLKRDYFELHHEGLRFKLGVLANKLPRDGFVCGRFTLADIVVGYNLRLAVQSKLLAHDAVEPYLGRLRERPAAKLSRVFDSL